MTRRQTIVKLINPYENEEQSIQIGELTIENRLDRVSLYGNIDLTRDKEGLSMARQIKMIVDSIVLSLEASEDAGKLPDRVETEKPDLVKNPFA
jgi:hypothetical protein